MDYNMEDIVDKSAVRFLSSCSSDTGDIFRDPLVLPRVGDQYQVEIPPLMMGYDRLQLIRKPTDAEVMIAFPNYFLLGLPIPIMWAQEKAREVHGNRDDPINTNVTVEVENSEESQITSNNEDAEPKIKPLRTALDDGEEIGGFSNFQPMVGGDKRDVDLVLPQEKKTKLDHGDNGYCPLPGSHGEPWRGIEHDSFLLGLYIFGKNLFLVKRFVKSKEMGDILSYYYGKFYRSDEHRRWSECRKMRSRRCIHGQKIFTGWRQQELLSRLFSHVSEECQNMLMEVSRIFEEGKFSLENYVFTLKNAVGINMLVEAVGIGKGKKDLTTMEPIKSNHFSLVRPEIPIGKACASLTSGDIIKFLTGDFRLSKARCSDLFWEAVWPRLLARGWHSEQPEDHAFASSKHCLVFLIPGVKKFSRRRLVKGNHYFDSVSDVLNKVASDPGLLELEIEAAEASGHKEENRLDSQIKQDPDGLSNLHRCCYLQPRISNCNRDPAKFTIVDTSLFHGEEWSKVRELRSLPVDTINMSIPSGLSSEIEHDSPEASHVKAEETNTLNPADNVTKSRAFAASPECVTSILKNPNNGLPNGSDPTIGAVENHEGLNTGMSTNKQLRRKIKFQFNQMVKSHSNYLAPIRKQAELSACSHGESNHVIGNISTGTMLDEEESHCCLNTPDLYDNMVLKGGPSQNLSSACSLAKGSPYENNEGILSGNHQGTEPSPEKHQPWTLIDLNLPHVPSELGTDEPFITDVVHNHDNSCANRTSFESETNQQSEPLKSSDGGANIEQLAVNGRRQSTRNRPLTTKALEAFACGFLSTRRKRKGVEGLSQNNSRSRSSRRVRGRTAVSATLNDSAANDIAQHKIEGADGGI